MADAYAFCPKCGSDRIVPTARLIDEGQSARKRAEVGVEVNPHALVFKNETRTPLQARVCGACGYTELFAAHPEALWKAYVEQRERARRRGG